MTMKGSLTKHPCYGLFFIHSFYAPPNNLSSMMMMMMTMITDDVAVLWHCEMGVRLCFLVTRGDAKILFSAANDGTIIAWGSGGAVHDRIPVS